VAQAATPPDPATVGETKLSQIELNGALGTELTVAPGEDVKIKANWEDNNTACELCEDFVATSFAGNPAKGCIENEGGFGFAGSGEVDLGSAPTKAGAYIVVAKFEQGNRCGETWDASASTGYQVIAKVTVTAPTPTNKEQCKGGGWRELTDGNGTPFKNQGQCVSFVNTGR
jgi:hypothetical protein